MKLGEWLDCAQYELRNALLHLLSADPSTAKIGQMWYRTQTNFPVYFNGTATRPMDAAALTDGSIQNSALATNPLARANHTGFQTSSTISDLSTTVKGYTLDSFAAAVNAVNFGTQRGINIAPATNATDIAQWAQVQAYVQACIQGQTGLKPPVRLYMPGNVNIAAPGILSDGSVSANAGDRILLGNQSTATQNEIYVYNGPSSAMTVPADSASGSQWIEGTEVLVLEGTTFGGAIFRQITTGTIVIGTNPLTFTQTFKINVYTADGVTTSLVGYQFSVKFDAATMTTTSGSLGVRTDVFMRKMSGTITTDGANSAFNFTHGFGTTDVIVGVRDSTGTKMFVDDNPANSSAVTITFGSVRPANETYRVTVSG